MQIHPYLSFAAIAIVTAPPNYIYQKWLEDAFPARVRSSRTSSGGTTDQLSKTNTVTKFLLDQTFGAAANTVAFIILMRLSHGSSLQQIRLDVRNDFVDMMLAGWRFWPLVTLTNLCLIPFEWRPAIGNTAGLCWGIYLNIREVMN